uniref:Carbohydrate kinase PfkB domain-containing protein n=2 Tax=Junco hyemalis TaxID=40217 RepID=A0A8C5NNI7_JUNHY
MSLCPSLPVCPSVPVPGPAARAPCPVGAWPGGAPMATPPEGPAWRRALIGGGARGRGQGCARSRRGSVPVTVPVPVPVPEPGPAPVPVPPARGPGWRQRQAARRRSGGSCAWDWCAWTSSAWWRLSRPRTPTPGASLSAGSAAGTPPTRARCWRCWERPAPSWARWRPGPPLSKCGAGCAGLPHPRGTGPALHGPLGSAPGRPPVPRLRWRPSARSLSPLSFITADFQRRGVDTAHVAWQPRGEVPCACCLVNAASGSRTIVLHDTKLPDVTARDFERVDLSQYRWIHFEARNAAEQGAMLERLERYNRAAAPERRVRVSVELEKPREELLPLMGRGQVVRSRGHGRDRLSLSPVPITHPDRLSRSPVLIPCPDPLSRSPVPIPCPGRGQRRGGGEVGTGAVRAAGVGIPAPGQSGSGGAGVGLDRGVRAGSGSSGGLWGPHQGTDLTAPGWGYRGCPAPAPLPQVFISKDLARHFGYQSAPEALRGLRGRIQPGATLICAWAEEGADALGPDGQLVHSDAFPPETLVDTLGAGDTFNAAVIFALAEGGHRRGMAAAGPRLSLARPRFSLARPQHSHGSVWHCHGSVWHGRSSSLAPSAGRSLKDALTFGCRIAGRKCGIQGFDGIV